MRILYSFFLYLLTPYLWLRLYWKGRYAPSYKLKIKERFALNRQNMPAIDIWIHAVSLGEVRALEPLIRALIKQGKHLLITTMTPTGFQQVQSSFGTQVLHLYIPYDLPLAMHRFFKKTKPRLGLIMETELWPNMIHYAHKANIPLYLINARLSQKSMRNYRKISFLMRPFLQLFAGIYAQSQEDALRFIQIGAKPSQVQVLGNIKFDAQPHSLGADFTPFKQQWGEKRTVFIAASTHANEEALILAELPILQKAIPKLLLLLAPRHPERFTEVYQLSCKAGYSTGRRSTPTSLSHHNSVIVLDSLGELSAFYPLCDYAFVGGSFVPIGGHNILEPIQAKVPVLSGPHYFNFKTICDTLKDAGAIKIVDNPKALMENIVLLHQDESQKSKQISCATHILKSNQGSLARYLKIIETVLS